MTDTARPQCQCVDTPWVFYPEGDRVEYSPDDQPEYSIPLPCDQWVRRVDTLGIKDEHVATERCPMYCQECGTLLSVIGEAVRYVPLPALEWLALDLAHSCHNCSLLCRDDEGGGDCEGNVNQGACAALLVKGALAATGGTIPANRTRIAQDAPE